MNKIAVILFNLGGPDSLDAVEPFLENLFNDPDIFKLPFQKALAKFIAKKRAPKVKKEYELIGNKSPIGEWTEIQRKKLENSLREIYSEIDVHVAMRYWKPLTETTAKKVSEGKYNRIILLPLYPHYSISTTGSSFNEWKRKYYSDSAEQIYINSYYKNELYLEAVNERINETIIKFPEEVRNNITLVFSAHGTPVSYVKKGDPYSFHIKSTIEDIMKLRKNDLHHVICFQSKVGPMKWLEPSTDDMIRELGEQKKMNLLIIPISFVSDHIETLFELDIEYRHIADEVGIENYIVMKGLNDSSKFIEALLSLVKGQL